VWISTLQTGFRAVLVLWVSMFRHVDYVQFVDFVNFDFLADPPQPAGRRWRLCLQRLFTASYSICEARSYTYNNYLY